MLEVGDRQQAIPPSLQLGDESIDQWPERSSVHQTRRTNETFACHHRPPVGAAIGFVKDYSYADRRRRSTRLCGACGVPVCFSILDEWFIPAERSSTAAPARIHPRPQSSTGPLASNGR